jgi:hypothetical protein
MGVCNVLYLCGLMHAEEEEKEERDETCYSESKE